MTPQQQAALAEIKTAWESEIVAGWDPNTAPVLRVTTDPPARVLTAAQAALALPPAYRRPRFVEFKVQYGIANGARVYRVLATLDGMTFQITEGLCSPANDQT